MAGVRHQHAIAAREAEISGEGGALVAAFFLHDLHQQHLAALDHVLNLVATTQSHALGAQFIGFLGVAAAIAALTAPAAPAAAVVARVAFGCFFAFMVERVFDLAILDGGHFVLFGRVDFGHAAEVIVMMRFVAGAGHVVGQAFAQFVVTDEIFLTLGDGAQGGFFLGVSGFFGQQGFPVFLRDLVVIRVDFAEGQEPVAIAAEIDEGRLQRRFDAGYLGEVDVAFDLLVFSGFKVEFFNPVALQHRHPGFFLVARIDQHALRHYKFSVRAAAASALRKGLRLAGRRDCMRNSRVRPGSSLAGARRCVTSRCLQEALRRRVACLRE